MRQRLSWLARLAVIFACVLVLGPAPMASAQSKQVWVFYMGFWNSESSWDAKSHVLDDYPTAGKYDARDKGTARSQIDQAKGAGIDAFVVAWRGSHDSAATDALKNVLKQAKDRDFKVGAVVDQYDGADQGQTTASLRYLMDEIIDQPAYLHYRGKPVIMFAFQKAFNWNAIRNQVDPDRRTLWIAEGLKGGNLYGGAMDGMYAFNLAWADGRSNIYARDRDAVAANGGSVYLPTFHPGWDEDKIARVEDRGNPTSRRDRANGDFLRSTWNGAVSAGTDVVLGVSWNEFIENSHIEPSNRYGTQALDTLRPLISAWKGGGPSQPPGGSVELLLPEADARQLIQFNPGASLQKRIFADGFVPNSGEFDVYASGRTWRGQRAEHLRTGQVRVYYTELDRWNDVRTAQRGAVAGDPVGRALLAEGERRQLIQFNPGASLQKRIFADGFVPNSPEFSSDRPGRRYAVQRTEHLGSGEVRVYYAPASNFADVRFLRGTPGATPRQTDEPTASPPTPSDDPMYIVQAWDAADGVWVDGKFTLPDDDVCTQIRWRTANIDEVYLQHVGYDDFPGMPQVGEGEITGCLESSDRGEQRWNLNVRLRNGDWEDDSIRLRGD